MNGHNIIEGGSMVKLDGIERQNLIMYLLSKVPKIKSYTQFYNLIYILKKEVGEDIFPDYKFNSKFLTIRDKVLESDLSTLVLQRYVNNDRTQIKSNHSHEIQLNMRGAVHLKANNLDIKLKSKLGDKNLKKLESAFIQHYNMDTKSLMEKTSVI